MSKLLSSVLGENIHPRVQACAATLSRSWDAHTVRAVRSGVSVLSLYPIWVTAFWDGKCLNTGHDFPGNFLAAITTKFYAAAADCSFGKKLRFMNSTSQNYISLKKDFRNLNACYLTFHFVHLQFAFTGLTARNTLLN